MSGTPTTDHAHEPCDDLHHGLFKGRHCGVCGEPLPVQPGEEALEIVRRLADALDGMTVADLTEVYGEDLAVILADAQALAIA